MESFLAMVSLGLDSLVVCGCVGAFDIRIDRVWLVCILAVGDASATLVGGVLPPSYALAAALGLVCSSGWLLARRGRDAIAPVLLAACCVDNLLSSGTTAGPAAAAVVSAGMAVIGLYAGALLRRTVAGSAVAVRGLQ